MRLTDCLHLSVVPRWSVVPMFRQQSVAEHAYRVAIISMEIAERMNVRGYKVDVGKVVRWALLHDGEECYTADIPTPFKRSLSGRIPASIWKWMRDELAVVHGTVELDIVKTADCMEATDFLIRWGGGAEVSLVTRNIIDRLAAFTATMHDKYGRGCTEALIEVSEIMTKPQPPEWMQEMAKGGEHG